eukprot:TRINITY_DN15730_c0_g1_i1.p1 TRINITY_DN15730_c0_g1~~TRINITY_DN15730_c0_g1_i1.p1  ORF type:complete len:196 (+),score=17.14 TRINITY_DN15730_c0_g1_i1:71-658(+)
MASLEPSAPARDIQGDQPQVVQGIPVGRPTGPIGDSYGLPPHGCAVVLDQRPLEEIMVMNYRCATKCFATIDVFSTLMNVSSLAGGRHGWIGLWSLILLIGPICGQIGACKLRRTFVAVYLGFCVLKIFWEAFVTIFLATMSAVWFLWLLLVLFVQIWITRIVAGLYVAMGKVGPQRLAQLAEGGEYAEARMIYW